MNPVWTDGPSHWTKPIIFYWHILSSISNNNHSELFCYGKNSGQNQQQKTMGQQRQRHQLLDTRHDADHHQSFLTLHEFGVSAKRLNRVKPMTTVFAIDDKTICGTCQAATPSDRQIVSYVCELFSKGVFDIKPGPEAPRLIQCNFHK